MCGSARWLAKLLTYQHLGKSSKHVCICFFMLYQWLYLIVLMFSFLLLLWCRFFCWFVGLFDCLFVCVFDVLLFSKFLMLCVFRFLCVLMTCLHAMLSEHQENNMFDVESVVFLMCWSHVCMKCYKNTQKTTRSKPNVSETNVITMCYTEMLSEPVKNNTFQAQSVRNVCNHKYVKLPGYLLQLPANFFYTVFKNTTTNQIKN